MKSTGVFFLLYLSCANLPGVTMHFDPFCGGHLDGPRGIIHTPNFPGPFAVPIKCRWVIDVSDIPSTNSSIVIYLTQLYVYKGLRFTEYAYYESESMNFGAALIKEVTEGNVFEYRRFRTFRPFLVVEFELDRLEGNHVRVLNDLLDVYGFNVTYEMTEEQPNPESCTVRDCSFAGNCLVSADYTYFWCDCFNGFSGRNCNEGPLCFNDEHNPVCQNEATCRQIGAEAMHCDCLDSYVGHNCETRLLDTLDAECASENCILQCPFDELQQPCTCKDGIKIYNNRSRYECRIKLSNVTSLRTGLLSQHGSLESFVSKQCLFAWTFSSGFPVKSASVTPIKRSVMCTYHGDGLFGIPDETGGNAVTKWWENDRYKSCANHTTRSYLTRTWKSYVALELYYANVARVCVRTKLSENGEREKRQWLSGRAKLIKPTSTTTLNIRPTGITETTNIPTFSEVCKRGALRIKPPNKQLTDMTCCQEPQSYHTQTTMADSGKTSWNCEELQCCRTITCGMLPTLRELASRGCNSQGSICLVPFDIEMDAASHLQMTLLEAYCREIGIKVLSVSKETIRAHLCPGNSDLSCVLITNDDPFFEPKLPK